MTLDDSYTCARCRRTFPKGWSDADALDELDTQFPGFTPEDCELVCDDCYREMGFGKRSGASKPGAGSQ